MKSRVADAIRVGNNDAEKKPKYPSTAASSTTTVRMSGLAMAMALILSSCAPYMLGRYCKSNVPSIHRAFFFQQKNSRFDPIERSSRALVSEENEQEENNTHEVSNDTSKKSSNTSLEMEEEDDDDAAEDVNENNDNHDDAVSPGAEHLLVDVTNVVDAEFLSSPDRLEAALSTLLQDHLKDHHELTTLERHGGGGGISFTILSLESHVFLHFWPDIGVLTLDIYKPRNRVAATIDDGDEEDDNDEGDDDEDEDEENEEEDFESLVYLVPVIKELFALGGPSSDDDSSNANEPAPHFYWAIKHRGLDYARDKSDPADSADYRMFYLGRRAFSHKEHVTTVETPFQTFEVYDVIDMRDEEQKLDRMLFLDHVVQSNRLGMEAYHEALVHPALTTHPNPRRVAIVGGGEGATLREVLKHSTVEKVVMIDIDGAMMNASRAALPDWNDCSDFVGSVGNCFDDPRAEVYAADAVGWFLDRYYGRDEIPEEEKFDVIIMDALDPSSLVGFSDVLYGNLALSQSMRNSLTDQGILVAQVGVDDDPEDPPEDYCPESSAAARMMRLFLEVGFEYTLDYSEQHCGFNAPWSFLIFFLDAATTKTRWYSSPAAIDLELSSRAIPTVSGEFPFHYFDGSSMATYQYPTRANQIIYCRSYPDSAGCRDLVEHQQQQSMTRLLPLSETNETTSSHTIAWRGSAHTSLSIMPSTAKLVVAHSGTASSMHKPIESAMHCLGYGHDLFGSTGYMIIPSPHNSNGEDKCNAVAASSNILELDYEWLYYMGNSWVARNQELLLAQQVANSPALSRTCVHSDKLH